MSTVEHVSASSPIQTLSTGSAYYAPHTDVVLTNDLRNTYAGLLAHQSQYLASHETLMKENIVSTAVDPMYGDVNSYYYHLE